MSAIPLFLACAFIAHLRVRPINFYNLDVVTDGSRQVNLCVADLSAVLPLDRPSMVDHLYALLDQPPSR